MFTSYLHHREAAASTTLTCSRCTYIKQRGSCFDHADVFTLYLHHTEAAASTKPTCSHCTYITQRGSCFDHADVFTLYLHHREAAASTTLTCSRCTYVTHRGSCFDHADVFTLYLHHTERQLLRPRRRVHVVPTSHREAAASTTPTCSRCTYITQRGSCFDHADVFTLYLHHTERQLFRPRRHVHIVPTSHREVAVSTTPVSSHCTYITQRGSCFDHADMFTLYLRHTQRQLLRPRRRVHVVPTSHRKAAASTTPTCSHCTYITQRQLLRPRRRVHVVPTSHRGSCFDHADVFTLYLHHTERQLLRPRRRVHVVPTSHREAAASTMPTCSHCTYITQRGSFFDHADMFTLYQHHTER